MKKEQTSMAKLGQGKTLLAAIDTTGSFFQFVPQAIGAAKKIGLSYGYSSVEATWNDDAAPVGQKAPGLRARIEDFQAATFYGGGGREMIDVLRGAHLHGGEPPNVLLVCSDFMESPPRPKDVDQGLLGWLSKVEEIAVVSLEIQGFEEEYAKQWAYEASEVFGRPVQVWRPDAMVALAEAQEIRDGLAKSKRKKPAAKSRSL